MLQKETADHFWELEQKVYSSNEKQAGEETFVDASGKERHYWTIKVPFKHEEGVQTLIGFSSDITELYNLKEELQRQAATDALTGLYSRRYFYEQVNREFSRSHRQQLPLSLLIIDIDLFKDISDQYGHPVGDMVLSSVASNFLSLIREEDVLARVGGEEFAILLPNTSLEAANNMAERIRHFHATPKKPVNGMVLSMLPSVLAFQLLIKMILILASSTFVLIWRFTGLNNREETASVQIRFAKKNGASLERLRRINDR